MLELRNKVVSISIGYVESVISPISKDGFGNYQLRKDICCLVKKGELQCRSKNY